MKLKCIKQSTNLTVGKIYDLVNVSSGYVLVKADNGLEEMYFASYFDLVN